MVNYRYNLHSKLKIIRQIYLNDIQILNSDELYSYKIIV